MPSPTELALEEADGLVGYERRLLSALVSERSVRGEASDIHELCGEELEKSGLQVEAVHSDLNKWADHPEWCPPAIAVAEPERLISVLGSWGEGPGILLFAHIDTEDPAAQAGWSADPYQAVEKNGRIYGLGAADDKAGVVSVLTAARCLIPHLEGVRLVVGLVHGKLGGGLGTLPAMDRVGDVEAAVYCHPAETGRGMAQIKTATRGFFNFGIQTRGRRPAPAEIRTPVSEDPRQGRNAFGGLRTVLDAVEHWADQSDLVCSFNRVRAGEDPTFLPEQALAEGAVWFRHGTFSEVFDRLSEVALRAGADSTRIFGMRSNPAEVAADHHLVQVTGRAVQAETGVWPGNYPAHVASDIRFPLRCLNVATVGLGALAGNFYGPDEWVNAADLHRVTRVIIRIVTSWASEVDV
ncbi:MAG: M20/M25/M40 family metallo-hydrolase [bacterium]|nr:M20/M25/M40 family metallo-hydrolase [bacterium]